MPPISPPRRTKSLHSLGGPSAHLLDEMTPAVTSANHSTFSPRNPLWNDLDFVPGRAKPRSIFSSYPTRSPSRTSRLRYRKVFKITQAKIYQSEAFSYPRKYFAQLRTFHLTLPMLMINIRETAIFRQFCDRRSTTKTITLRVAQPTSTLTTQPFLHHVKEGRAKDARRHELVRQLFARNSKATFPH